jgi:hypothetical protein
MPFFKGKIIHSQYLRRNHFWQNRFSHHSQYRRSTYWQSNHLTYPCPWLTPAIQAYHLDLLIGPFQSPLPRPQAGAKTFGKHFSWTRGLLTDKLPGTDIELYGFATDGQVLHFPLIITMHFVTDFRAERAGTERSTAHQSKYHRIPRNTTVANGKGFRQEQAGIHACLTMNHPTSHQI